MSGQFRADIQGLRALAVIAVLLYHVDLFFVPGGFLGVDIFFVISGFLISGNILRSCESRSFSMFDFVLRRMRRLLPAAAVTIVLSLIGGYFILSSSDYAEAGRSGLAALFFSSNFVFWAEAGYFDAASHTKPFLHFWSLSVEEQFYLFWPVLMLLGFRLGRKVGAAIVVGGLSLVSLVVAEVLFDTASAATFFLMPFRVFEFGIGALIAVLNIRLPKGILSDLGVLVGIVLMVFSIVVLDDASRMPGLLSLIPLLGCGLVLMSPQSLFGVILSNPVASYIGNASYSIYLVHWPLVVFVKYQTGEDLSLLAQIILIGSSLLVGAGFYHLIETPFRREGFWKREGVRRLPTLLGAGVAFAGISAMSTGVWMSGGLTARFATPVQLQLNQDILRQETLDFRDTRDAEDPGGRRRIYVVGDSFGRDFANAINFLTPDVHVEHNWIPFSCQAVIADRASIKDQISPQLNTPERIENCEAKFAEAITPEKLSGFDLVVFVSRWQFWTTDYLPETVQTVQSRTDAPVILVTQATRFSDNVPSRLERTSDINIRSRVRVLDTRVPLDQIAEQVAFEQEYGFPVLNKLSLLCPQDSCPLLYGDAPVSPLYYDDMHLTLEGARFLADQLRSCDQRACEQLLTVVLH